MASNILTLNKKYFWLISLIFFLMLLSGVLSPILIEKEKANWEKTLVDKIDYVASSINQTFETKTDYLIAINSVLKKDLHSVHPNSYHDQRTLFKILSDKKYLNLSAQINESTGDLIAWTSEPVLDKEGIIKHGMSIGQSFFVNQKLLTHLAFADTLKIGDEVLFILVSLPVEKHYTLSQKNDLRESVTDSLSNFLSTKVEIDYSPFSNLSKDGRKYSFSILNNYKNKIGIATFDKPSLEIELSRIQKTITVIQFSFLITLVIILGIWFRGYLLKLERKLFRFIGIASFLSLIRYLLFVFEIPSSFIRSSVNDSSNFSSVFAFGMVRSPLEFLITILFLLLIVMVGYNFVLDYFNKQIELSKKSTIRFITSSIISISIFLLCLRGFGAAIRSVIFDSTIRYFKDFALIPAPPILLMNFNILALGFCSVILSIILLLLIFSQYQPGNKKKTIILFLILFFFLQVFGWIFDLIQDEPQGTPLIRLIYITIIFALAYIVIFLNRQKGSTFVYYSFAASIVSVSLLTYYNSQIEKESLKTTAHELTRTNEDLIQFMVYETLVQIRQDEHIINSLNEWGNLSSEAFILWTGSLLYREGVQSAINFFDLSQNFIGGYQTGKIVPFGSIKEQLSEINDSLKIIKETNLYGNKITLTGIAALKENNKILGYVVVTAVYDDGYFNFADLPKILVSPRGGISSAVNFDKLKIFDFRNGELIRSYSGVELSREEQNIILNSEFTAYSESWLNMNINNENHLIYALKMDLPAKNRVLAVAIEEKNFSWNLSDFFKVFFVHTVIITFLVFGFVLVQYKKTKIIFASYRTRLIGAFLLISIIPLLIIALYFRSITEEKNTQLIEKRLTEMSEQVESYLNLYASSTSVGQFLVFEKAARDLNINFSIYADKYLLFSSQEVYSEVGLLQSTINSFAYSNCVLRNNQRISAKENLENISINSVYSLAKINDQNVIIKVDDLFNRVSVPLSDIELDIFLFGIFSLAVLLLFILSTILADQISSPIRKLTSATKSVGNGDLNVQVNYKTNGEIKDLVEGFNKMVKKIEQSQFEIAQMERESAWKEMAKQVAHEIKNPLTPMKLNIQQLIAAYKDKSPKFDSIFDKVTTTIISQIETLKNIASEFSNFARMPRLNIEKLNATSLIRESLNLFDEEKRKINFECSNEVIFVNADQDQLKRTIVNLLRNSIQAGANQILVSLKVTGEICNIYIHDDGIGIEPNIIPKVFDENFTTKKSGMGIGLSLAKRFVESIGGNIIVEKTSKDGTTFLITLPVAE